MPEEKKAPADQTINNNSKKESTKIDPTTLKSGMTVKIHQIIKEVNTKGEEKERIQVYEGLIIAKKGKTFTNTRILVRKISANRIGVEKLFPIASPNVAKIEIIRESKIRRAKLYFTRTSKKKLRERKTTV